MNPAEFCRELETYLCRKNDGHLIRIVGPVFEQVCGWAAQGVPIKIACRGIDRYFERQETSMRRPAGARRRPVRIEFCEADILDAFDEWRRAVGISASALARDAESTRDAMSSPAGMNGAEQSAASATWEASATSAASGTSPGDRTIPDGSRAVPATSAGTLPRDEDAPANRDRVEASSPESRAGSPSTRGGAGGDAANAGDPSGESEIVAARRKAPLLTHIDRAMARLTQRRVDGAMDPGLGEAIDRVLRELDTMRAGARGARGDARQALLDRLAAIDRTLITAARTALESAMTMDELRAEAGRELDPFRTRLSAEAFRAALEAALDRLVRDRWRLPSLRLDE